jgi:type IV pilus assembly protein PilW
MLIALFLVAGILIVEQGVHTTYTDNSGLSQLEDMERYSMTVVSDAIEPAGYFPDPISNTLVTALPALTVTTPQGQKLIFQSGQAVYGVYQAAAPHDSIAVRFMAGATNEIDLCDGTKAVAGDAYISYLYIDSASNTLYCELYTAAGGWSATPLPLQAGVKDMSILYGLNTDGIDNDVETYLFAPDVPNWSSVGSARVTLTFANPLASEKGQNPQAVFTRVIAFMSRTGVYQP